MKHIRWQVYLGLALVVLSLGLYVLHFVFFQDMHHILIYFVGDVAFLPVEVLLVTLVLHQLLHSREQKAKLSKLNMVIGTFFSEVGQELLRTLSSADPALDVERRGLLVSSEWSDRQFAAAIRLARTRSPEIACSAEQLELLKRFLLERRDFLLRLLENPNLLEHDRFTDVLWAVFHLTDELANRKDISSLPAADIKHLEGDVRRVYGLLLSEWLAYMRHLKSAYPYLFSLAARISPLNPHSSAEVR